MRMQITVIFVLPGTNIFKKFDTLLTLSDDEAMNVYFAFHFYVVQVKLSQKYYTLSLFWVFSCRHFARWLPLHPRMDHGLLLVPGRMVRAIILGRNSIALLKSQQTFQQRFQYCRVSHTTIKILLKSLLRFPQSYWIAPQSYGLLRRCRVEDGANPRDAVSSAGDSKKSRESRPWLHYSHLFPSRSFVTFPRCN